MFEIYKSEKPNLYKKKPIMAGCIRRNVLKIYKLRKPDSHEKKSTVTKGTR